MSADPDRPIPATPSRPSAPRPRRGAALLALLSLAIPAAAGAQEDDTARARVLFEQGVAHVDAGEWPAAAARFREALALKNAPAVRYNLASALVALEEYAEAEALAQALAEGEDTPADLRQRARELIGQIDRAAGRLTVDLRGATGGVTIRIEGEGAAAGHVTHRYALRPSRYTVVVEREGRELERREVSVGAGQSADVSLAVAPSAEEAAAASAEPAPAEPLEDGGGDITSDWRFWAAIGGAVALTILVAVLVAQ